MNADGGSDVQMETTDGGATNVHVSGEYQDDIYNVKYTNDNELNAPSVSKYTYTLCFCFNNINTYFISTANQHSGDHK